MIAIRRIPRDEWEAELRSYGCKPLDGKGKLNTAEFWRTPWHSYPFTVPVEGGFILRPDLDELVAWIASAAPEGWQFDP